MDVEEAVKTGSLLIPFQSFLWKTWTKRLCALYRTSNHGIQRIEVFESEDAFVKLNPNKIIPLTDCIKVTPAPQKQQINVFEVRTKENVYQFSAETFQDMTDWLLALQNVAFGEASKLNPNALIDEKHEENMLYSSMNEPEVFSVKAGSTEATVRNTLNGDYKLVITPVNISVAEEGPQGKMGKILLTWPYRHIRRYGCTTENFSFEAGRKCISGEGLFTFSTHNGMIIFQSVDAHVSALKSSQNESEISNSPNMNEDSLLSKRDSSFFLHQFESNFSISKSLDSKSISKTVTPISKPPRKGKSRLENQTSSANIPQAKEVSRKNSGMFNNHEEIFKGNSFHCSSPVDNSTLLCNAYCDDQQISETNHVIISSSAEKCFATELVQENPTMKTSQDINCDSTFKRYSISKSDHVYGNITGRRSLQSKEITDLRDSTILNCSTAAGCSNIPLYSNVDLLKNSSGNMNILFDAQMDPEHFLQNGTEYAQVFKKSEDKIV